MSCREQTLPSSRSAALLRMGDMWREGLADGRESSASAAEMYKLAALRNEPQVARLTSHCFFFFPSWDNLLFSKASETGLFSFPPQRVGTTWACWWKRASGHQRRCSPSSAFPASPLRTSTRLRLLSTKGLLKRPQKMNNYLSVGDRVCGGKKPDHPTDVAFPLVLPRKVSRLWKFRLLFALQPGSAQRVSAGLPQGALCASQGWWHTN